MPATPDSPSRVPVRLGAPLPYLRVEDASAAIAFYAAAFGAVEVVRLEEPSGRTAHAELRFGEGDAAASVMLSSEYPELGLLGPRARGGASVALQLYVADLDATCARIEAAGGTITRAAALDPFGDRTARVVDPGGHEWIVAQRMESITAAEMSARWNRMMGGAE